MKKNLLASLSLFLILASVYANEAVPVSKDEFIRKMAAEHAFDTASLTDLLEQATVSKTILEAISRPAEKKLVWHEYKKIFLIRELNSGVLITIHYSGQNGNSVCRLR